MARKSIPVMEWAQAHHSVVFDDDYEPRHIAPARRGESDQRFRSLSMSLPWKRPKHSLFGHDDIRDPTHHVNDAAIDDSHDGPEHLHGPTHVKQRRASGSLKGIIRRASMSLKGIVHRRPSVAAADVIYEQGASNERPTTSHGPWNRLGQAANFRHSRSFYDLDLYRDPNRHVPIPGLGDEPPVIPHHTGAAAKASAAMQNEYFARQRGLNPPSSDDGNDRESGIGIAVTRPSVDLDNVEQESVLEQDSRISRIDFVSELPPELAIHILACLDAPALAKASAVSRQWHHTVSNQHIWRESCLREITGTYATSRPVQPGAGMGVPQVRLENDWKQIYKVKLELSQRWKEGKARPVYLHGHTDSIYCLQFDEFKIVSGSRDKTIRVWDMHTMNCKLVIGPPEVVNSPHLLADEEGNPTHYAAGSDNEQTALSLPNTVSFPEHHKASILCLQYDDEILVTGSSDSTCIVYDVKAGYRPIRRLRHHTAAVLDLAFDKKHIVTCSKDISICVWDRETGALLRQLRGHTGPVNAVQMRGNTIVSCSGDFRVKLWNIDTGKNIREFVGHTKGLACSQFSEDGRFVASAGNDKVIRIWDANTGECVREMKAHENLVRSLHIDSVSGRLVSGSYDSDIKVWDMETGNQLLDFPRWHSSWVLSAKSDYRRIVSTGQDPKILIMDFGAEVDGIQQLETSAAQATD
ncbi:F-box and WD40 domain protein, putative [Metarhizium acridum CQMa 102]|uniref:F-box and WD40 domain protein, putative n=1 Tax=Metarhizium acridum (strain CQMa 102) TaxID=655827 RepID=E9EI34_METAQ|nr:F-box and WD40 domain protein, putative [Metarhizium acridum CQMa 102]EFY84430.1 F-box and WD40 domain protein, putative [Metarhizium acridum CQMa 102]